MVLSLAIIHHLYISQNLSFQKIAEFFSNLSKWIIIEFVPETDNQFSLLVQNRCEKYNEYNQLNFENEFLKYFDILQKIEIDNSCRILYLMFKK